MLTTSPSQGALITPSEGSMATVFPRTSAAKVLSTIWSFGITVPFTGAFKISSEEAGSVLSEAVSVSEAAGSSLAVSSMETVALDFTGFVTILVSYLSVTFSVFQCSSMIKRM